MRNNLSTYEDDFVIGDLQVYREFDASHFISNANTALHNKANTVELGSKFNFYSTMLEKAINAFSNVVVDNDSIKTFLGNYEKNPSMDLSSLSTKQLDSLDVISIRPQYIGQYTTMVGEIIDKVLKGEADNDLVIKFSSGEYPLKVQRQVVKTSLPYGVSSKELIKIRNNNPVSVSADYIKDKVVPFVTSYSDLKQKTLAEANATLNAIKETELTMKSMINVINKKKLEGGISPEKLNSINQLTYNAIRGILEIISFTTYMMIRKLNIISSNIVSCNGLYTDMSNLSSGIEESVSLATVLPTDTASLTDDFIGGSIGALGDTASRIYDYHVGIPGNIVNTEEEILDVEVGQRDFDSAIYKETFKIYDSINGGLDRMAALSDEYFMVFDNIIKDSGFEMPLEDRYKTYLDSIDDVTEYRSAKDISHTGRIDKLVYQRILAELRQFPELVQNIADICKETKVKMDILIKRFAQNANGEYKDAETVNEIKIFLSSLEEQYRTMTNLVCGKFMHRLHEIGNILSELEANDEAQHIIPDTTPIDTDSNVDFSEGVNDTLFDEIEEETEDIMHRLELEYYAEKMKKRTGVEIRYEAPNPASPTSVPPQQPAPQPAPVPQPTPAPQPSTNNATGVKSSNTQPQSQSVTVQDNDIQPPKPATSTAPAQNTTTTPSPTQPGAPQPPKGPTEKYNTIADKFSAAVEKKAGKPGAVPATQPVATESALYTEGNIKFMNDNKDELLTRRYTNVSVQRVNGTMTDEDTIKALTDIATNISRLADNPGNLQGIKNQNDAVNATCAAIVKNLNPNDDIKKQARNYFMTGSIADPTPQTIANGDLKLQVQNELIPRVEKFYSTNSQALAQAAKEVGSALDKLKNACTQNTNNTNKQQSQKSAAATVAQPVMASTQVFGFGKYSLFAEADNATAPNQVTGNANTQTSLKDVYKMIERVANDVTSSALNARFTVNNDDIKEANALVPKANATMVKSNTEKGIPSSTQGTTESTSDYKIMVDGEMISLENYLDKIENYVMNN